MLLLAQNCNEINPSLEDTVTQVISSLDGIAKVFIEHGRRLINNEGEDLEHFGYRDGISNPLFFTDEIKEKRGARYDLSAPLGLVLVEDPHAGEDGCYGSYLVFRKLKQNVRTFNTQVGKLSEYVNPGNPKLTGAQIVGRFKDGTPVTDFNSPQGSDADTNNFNFATDDGRRCPVHAHIRKANPRDGRERSRRIVRRGIPYGKPGDDEVGLLFMCYQSNIHDQFEFLQRVWVDNSNFPVPGTGDDPLIGQDKTAADQQEWSIEYDSPGAGKKAFDFGGHVTLKGGEYFFAPSLSFLQGIK